MSAIMYSINGYSMNERKGQISCYLVKGKKKWSICLLLFDSLLHQAAAVFASTAALTLMMAQTFYKAAKETYLILPLHYTTGE
jgi:hypothetical protein